jgi:hypothetical protein
MKRAKVVLLIGPCVAAVGAFVYLRADSLATRWQLLGEGAWGGTTDPSLRQSYEALGLLALGFGGALLLMAGWNWMAAGRDAGRHP